MADLELVEGEAGDNYDITIKDKRGNIVNLTAKGFTAVTLYIADDDDFVNPVKTITGLSIVGTNNEIVRWVVSAAHIPPSGNYEAMFKFTGGGGLVRYSRPTMTVHVQEKMGT